jgi:hypothetical protein
MEVGGQRQAPAALRPAERTDTHCKGRWVNSRTTAAATGSGTVRRPAFYGQQPARAQQSTCVKRPAVENRPNARVQRPAASSRWLQYNSWSVISGQRLTTLRGSVGSQEVVSLQR